MCVDLAGSGDLPAAAHGRRRLLLGHTEDGREFWLAARGRNVLVTGDTKSGKSWVAGLLCEQLILHGYCVCVIDPEGDYRSLEALPGVTVLGGEDPPPSPRDLMRALRYPDRSVVIDLSRLPQDEKLPYIRTTLGRRSTSFASAPDSRIGSSSTKRTTSCTTANVEGLLDLERNGYTVVTYCASRLPQALLDSTEVIIVTCESNPAEIDALFKRCERGAAPAARSGTALSRLRPGQAVALPITAESEGQLRLFTRRPSPDAARPSSPEVRGRPVSEPRAFVFTTTPTVRARTLRQFVRELERNPARGSTRSSIAATSRRWIRDVFGDHALAAELRAIESRHRGRAGPDTVPDLIDAIRARYDLRDDALVHA